MSSSKQDAKGSKSHGTIVVVFVLLFVVGGAIAYWVVFGGSDGSKKADEPRAAVVEQPKVVETKSLVETPPPLPEETPPMIQPDASTAKHPTGKGGGGGLAVTGTINAAAAKSYIRSRSAMVRACYEKELKVNNLLQGSIKTDIIVNLDGTVASVKFISDSVRSPAMNQCIKKEIDSWVFPKPEGGRAEVQFPFKFEPKN